MEGDQPKQELKYGLPEHLAGKKVHTQVSHQEGDRRWKEEEWSGAGADPRAEPDTGVPGTSSPSGKVPETVEGREGWRD